MLDFNLITGILVAIFIILFIRFGLPYIRKNGYSNIYTDIKAGLLLFGYAFRDEKIKAITDLILKIVQETERLDVAPEEKREEAVNIAFRTLIKELNLEIEEKAIKTIVNIAVAYLPPTNRKDLPPEKALE